MLRDRISRLERQLLPDPHSATCPKCGGPSPGAPWSLLVDENRIPLQPTCDACGLPLDANGKGRGRRVGSGTPVVKLVVLASDATSVVSLDD
jgi:hypothetical protein